MNKRGFDCAPSRATSRASFRRFSASLPHLPPFFPPYYPSLLRCFFSFLSCTLSGLEPLTFRITLAYKSLFYTATPRDSIEDYPPKSDFFTWLVCIPKICITIYLLTCLKHAARKHASHLWVLGE